MALAVQFSLFLNRGAVPIGVGTLVVGEDSHVAADTPVQLIVVEDIADRAVQIDEAAVIVVFLEGYNLVVQTDEVAVVDVKLVGYNLALEDILQFFKSNT